MGKRVLFNCDYCNNDITRTKRMPQFRLCLSAEPLPHTSQSQFAEIVHKPIEDDRYFCNLSHLLGWLETAAVPSPLSKTATPDGEDGAGEQGEDR